MLREKLAHDIAEQAEQKMEKLALSRREKMLLGLLGGTAVAAPFVGDVASRLGTIRGLKSSVGPLRGTEMDAHDKIIGLSRDQENNHARVMRARERLYNYKNEDERNARAEEMTNAMLEGLKNRARIDVYKDMINASNDVSYPYFKARGQY